ncbi:hypothetical protein ACQ4PT_027356 [Festuca glaucescens]
MAPSELSENPHRGVPDAAALVTALPPPSVHGRIASKSATAVADTAATRCDNQESKLHSHDESSKPDTMKLQYLKEITNNFSDDLILGRGGFGVVYKGIQQNGETVAIKKFLQPMPNFLKQFKNEVDLLVRLKHPNIVRLIGYCYETQNVHTNYNGKFISAELTQSLLCLEYAPKGSLDKYISDESRGLDWRTRYTIIEGICHGLQYLHEQIKPIIHLDLKPGNILLADNMVPKVTDFGLSRLFDQQQTMTTLITNGTLGYMPPEYIQGGTITPMSDIFSLGVIILELVTGHRDYPDVTRTSSEDFIELTLKKWSDVLKKAPGYTSLEVDCQQIKNCIQIGLICVNPERTKRPTAAKVIKMLQGLERSEKTKTTKKKKGYAKFWPDFFGKQAEAAREALKAAAAYGDLEKLQRLVEAEGQLVTEPDSLGYHALQWAALNNCVAIVQYILEHGADVNAVDHTGQTALHWSSVRGYVQVADLLLQGGAKVDAPDFDGYQATHVAAQYGQAIFIHHLVEKWNANPDPLDHYGRSPLHWFVPFPLVLLVHIDNIFWAAYKGFPDSIRVLLYLNVYRMRQDKQGVLDDLLDDLPKSTKLQNTHLVALIEVHNMTDTFARIIRHIFSESDRGILLDTMKAIYYPYEVFKVRYGQMERAVLSTAIAGIDICGTIPRGTGAQGLELSETVHRMNASIPKMIALLEAAVERCISLTGGSEADELVLVLDDIMLQYISNLQETLKPLRTSKDLRFHVLPVTSQRVAAFSEMVKELVYYVLMSRVRQSLSDIALLPIWSSMEEQGGPCFSAYPQVYVTSVGDYLLTLHCLEPLNVGRAEGATALFMEQLRRIHYITDRGAQQLAADIEYLNNVLSALSMPIPPFLSTFHACISTPRDQVHGLIKSDGGSQLDLPTAHLVSKIRRIPLDQ